MTETTARGWTLQRKARKCGAYYQLIKTGRGPDGKRTTVASIALSAARDVTEDEAETALAAIRDLAVRGAEAPILAAYDKPTKVVQTRKHDPSIDDVHEGEAWLREGRAAIVEMLCRESGIDAILAVLNRTPTVETPPADLTLKVYHDTIYWRARSGVKPDGAREVGAPKTLANEIRVWKLINASPLGRTKIKDLDAWKFQAYLDAMIITRRPQELADSPKVGTSAAPRTKALHRSSYQGLLNFAHRKGHVRTKHEFFRLPGATKGTAPKEEPLTLIEVRALLDGEIDPMRRCLWAVAVGMGLRPSEMERVQWGDIHLDAYTLDVRGTKTTASKATVPLTPFAHVEIVRFRDHLIASNVLPVGLVFQHEGGPIGCYRRSLTTSARRAKITRRVHPYLLRATFATLAYLLKVPKDVTRRIGRWTDDRMLDDVYCRPLAADLVAMASTFVVPEKAQDVEPVEAPAMEVTEADWLRLMGA